MVALWSNIFYKQVLICLYFMHAGDVTDVPAVVSHYFTDLQLVEETCEEA